MTRTRQQRLIQIAVMLLLLGAAAAFILYALRQNISLFYTPTQVLQQTVPAQQVFRLGGIVQPHSIHYRPGSLTINFQITDQQHAVPVQYTGVLPDLFREGQGVVVEGQLTPQGVFMASQVLAKHDEKYMPPMATTPSKPAATLSNAASRIAS